VFEVRDLLRQTRRRRRVGDVRINSRIRLDRWAIAGIAIVGAAVVARHTRHTSADEAGLFTDPVPHDSAGDSTLGEGAGSLEPPLPASDPDSRTNRRGRVLSILITLALLSIPLGAYLWYRSVAREPGQPPAGGGLYLAVDRPNVVAQLSVQIAYPTQSEPAMSVYLRLSDPSAKFALFGSGPMEFPHTSIAEGRVGASDLRIGTGSGQTYADFGTSYIGGTYSEGKKDWGSQLILLALSHPVANSGRGFTNGRMPEVSTESPLGHVDGDKFVTFSGDSRKNRKWMWPESSKVSVSVQTPSSFTAIDSTNPPAKSLDPLTWEGVGRIGTMGVSGPEDFIGPFGPHPPDYSSYASDPDSITGAPNPEITWQSTDTSKVNTTSDILFFLGTILGLWASSFVGWLQWLSSGREKRRAAAEIRQASV